MRRLVQFAAAIASVVLVLLTLPSGSSATPDAALRRYPYLTDMVKRTVTVNWATTTAIGNGRVLYGRLGVEPCDAHSARAKRQTITVRSTNEYQWRARLTGLVREATYCYRIRGGGRDLLGADPTPTFRTQVRRRSGTPFSFAVIGDWGQVDSHGQNPYQADVLAELADSDARFAVTTGDVAYPDGSQQNYGDLVQTGSDTSAIFGPDFWTVAGDHIPMFNVLGNHGLKDTTLINWPEGRVRKSSDGRYRMETYCCVNGTSSKEYPSAWYAFNAGGARFYILDATWSNGNLGHGSLYQNDHDSHWTVGSAEYQWLQHDLATHDVGVAFAFFHFPLYSPNATESSDAYLQGPSPKLEGLLGKAGVDIVFNGHAHVYARSTPSAPGMPITYVTGGGGGRLEPVSKCGAPIAYAIGWSYSSSEHGSSCGPASDPTRLDQVFHYLLVRVNGDEVTVTPTNAAGATFDVKTFTFP
jgi:hypothetical protein